MTLTLNAQTKWKQRSPLKISELVMLSIDLDPDEETGLAEPEHSSNKEYSHRLNFACEQARKHCFKHTEVDRYVPPENGHLFLRNASVSPEEFISWITRNTEWEMPVWFTKWGLAVLTKEQSVMNAIVSAVKRVTPDPMRMPEELNGKAGIKSKVWAVLMGGDNHADGMTRSTFNKGWSRCRSKGLIAYLPGIRHPNTNRRTK